MSNQPKKYLLARAFNVSGGIQSAAQIEQHWKDGRDFIVLATGQHFSNRDMEYLRAHYDALKLYGSDMTGCTCIELDAVKFIDTVL